VPTSCSKVFGTEEAQADLRFAELLDGTNKILVVCAVAPGSKAEKVCWKVALQHTLPQSFDAAVFSDRKG